ncbi:MAG: DUF3857 domain-containing protein [Lentisphaeria bacterium]|jgi:hypothetical protein
MSRLLPLPVTPRLASLGRRLLLAAAALAPTLARPDLIVLRDGREYKGTLLEATAETLRFRHAGQGQEERFPRAEAIHVRLQDERDWDAVTRAADIPDPDLRQRLAQLPALARQHPDAPALTLLRRTVIRLRTPQTWTWEQHRLDAMLKEDGEEVSLSRHAFRKDAERFRIRHAATIRPDGTLLQLDDDAIQEEAPFASLPEHDKVAVKRFALPEGRSGNAFAWAVETERHTPVPGQYLYLDHLFSAAQPLACDRVEVLVPAGCELRGEVLNDPEGTVQHTTEPAGAGGTWHRWERRNAPRPLPEPMQPPPRRRQPRLVLSSQPGGWEDVARQAMAAMEPAAPDLPPPPAAATTPAAVWEALSRAIEEVPIPATVTGLQPQDPRETLRRRRGTPLDRAYLLARWLKPLAPDAALVWLRPRPEGTPAPAVPAREALPLPAVRFTWQREAMVVAPGDNLQSFAEARLARTGDTLLLPGGRLETVAPPTNPVLPGLDREVQLRLRRDGTAEVEETIRRRGADARTLRAWRALTPAEIRNRVEQEAHAIHPRATQIRHEILDSLATNAPELRLKLHYEIPGFADVREGLLCARLPWLQADASAVGRGDRRLPLWWDEPRLDTITLDIAGPPGLALRAAPDAVELRSGGLSFTAAAEAAGENHIRWRQTYRRDALEAPAAAYPRLKETLERRANLGRQFWIWTE